MYLPDAFAVTDEDEIAAMLARARLYTLVGQGPEGLYASHLPMLHDPARGTLAGHLARANPHRAMVAEGEALAILLLDEAYVSPGFYPSKGEHGRVVPTWNYEAVHLYGRLAWHDGADWIRANVAALTDRFERDRAEPWAVTDAPVDYLAGMVRGVVGVELQVTRVEAKRKLSQNRAEADRAGVVAALSRSARDEDRAVAAAMRTLAP